MKQYPEWQSAYFIFNGIIVRSDAPGNIAYGIAGELLGIPQETLLAAAGAAQIAAGTSQENWSKYYGDDPYDQMCILIGINYVR